MSSDHLVRLFMIGSLAMGGACVDQRTVAPSANDLVVQAVLDVSARDQYVIVQSTTGAIGAQQSVSGAQVALVTPGGSLLAADEIHDSTLFAVRSGEPPPSSVYRVSLDRYGALLVEGATYSLRVSVPDGRTVSGTTTIPMATSGAPPTAMVSLDHLRDSLRLSWPHVPGARSYQVFITSPASTYTAFVDTGVALPGGLRTQDGYAVFVAGQTAQLVVTAVDSNFYDYYRTNSDEFTARGVIGHLQGALGVFGSVVPILSRTVVVR